MAQRAPLERYSFERYLLEVPIATLERGIRASKIATYEFPGPQNIIPLPQKLGLGIELNREAVTKFSVE